MVYLNYEILYSNDKEGGRVIYLDIEDILDILLNENVSFIFIEYDFICVDKNI